MSGAPPQAAAANRPLTGWVPLGALYRAVATENLIEMGWHRPDAVNYIVERRANQDTLTPIITWLRKHRVYDDESYPTEPNPNLPPGADLPEPNEETAPALQAVHPTEDDDGQNAVRDREVEAAMGAAHFQIKDLIHDKRVEVRGTVTRMNKHGCDVASQADVPEQFLFDPRKVRRADHRTAAPIPSYEEGMPGGIQSIGDDYVEVSQAEVFLPDGLWRDLYPEESPSPSAASIVVYSAGKTSRSVIAGFHWGARSASLPVKQHLACLICLLAGGQGGFIRWDRLEQAARALMRLDVEFAEILLPSSSPETHPYPRERAAPEYREIKERVYRGLASELSHLAAECPWLYGQVGPLEASARRALIVDERGAGVRYKGPLRWECEIVRADV